MDGFLFPWTFSIPDFEPITGRSPAWEKSIGMHETTELGVMCDTFHPLKLSTFAKGLDDGKCAYSWYENAPDVAGAEAAVDGDASGAGLTSRLESQGSRSRATDQRASVPSRRRTGGSSQGALSASRRELRECDIHRRLSAVRSIRRHRNRALGRSN